MKVLQLVHNLLMLQELLTQSATETRSQTFASLLSLFLLLVCIVWKTSDLVVVHLTAMNRSLP